MATVDTLEQALNQQITGDKINFVHRELLFAYIVNTEKNYYIKMSQLL
jgi:hypothetical protein